jgi:hypothetical protein
LIGSLLLATWSSSFLRASSRAFSRSGVLLVGVVLALQVLVQIGLAHAQRGKDIAFGGFVQPDIGHDALGLDAAPDWACSSARW